MDAITALTQRVSVSKLKAPAPSPDELELMFQVALRAPDHGLLTPWRYYLISGELVLTRLGEAMLSGALVSDPNLAQDKQLKIRQNPLRAPLVIIAAANVVVGTKIPEIEQLLSVAASVQNLQNAAWALGYASIWRTGPLAYDEAVRSALGLSVQERIIGFIYMGRPAQTPKIPPKHNMADYVKSWE